MRQRLRRDLAPTNASRASFKLPHIAVLVVAAIRRPAEEKVRRGLHDALADHDPLALVGVKARPRIRRQHRGTRLLHLQQQRRVVAASPAGDGAERADAADAHHLERDIGQPVAVQQHAALLRQAELVGVRRPRARPVRACRRACRDSGISSGGRARMRHAPLVLLDQLGIALVRRVGRHLQPLQGAVAQPQHPRYRSAPASTSMRSRQAASGSSFTSSFMCAR